MTKRTERRWAAERDWHTEGHEGMRAAESDWHAEGMRKVGTA